MKHLTFPHDSSIKMTVEQAHSLGIDTTVEEMRGVITDSGHPWYVTRTYKAMCIDTLYEKNEWGIVKAKEVTFFGSRTMTNVRQSGYELEGWVSIKGKKYSCFTSSSLVEVDGKLINLATICARYTKFPKRD